MSHLSHVFVFKTGEFNIFLRKPEFLVVVHAPEGMPQIFEMKA